MQQYVGKPKAASKKPAAKTAQLKGAPRGVVQMSNNKGKIKFDSGKIKADGGRPGRLDAASLARDKKGSLRPPKKPQANHVFPASFIKNMAAAIADKGFKERGAGTAAPVVDAKPKTDAGKMMRRFVKMIAPSAGTKYRTGGADQAAADAAQAESLAFALDFDTALRTTGKTGVDIATEAQRINKKLFSAKGNLRQGHADTLGDRIDPLASSLSSMKVKPQSAPPEAKAESIKGLPWTGKDDAKHNAKMYAKRMHKLHRIMEWLGADVPTGEAAPKGPLVYETIRLRGLRRKPEVVTSDHHDSTDAMKKTPIAYDMEFEHKKKTGAAVTDKFSVDTDGKLTALPTTPATPPATTPQTP